MVLHAILLPLISPFLPREMKILEYGMIDTIFGDFVYKFILFHASGCYLCGHTYIIFLLYYFHLTSHRWPVKQKERMDLQPKTSKLQSGVMHDYTGETYLSQISCQLCVIF